MPPVHCAICKDLIVKYEMDIGNTVALKIKRVDYFICDRCSHAIALQWVNR
jgi:uncharacterized protein YlaI